MLLLPVLNNLGEETGEWRSSSGFVVKDFRVTHTGTPLELKKRISPYREGDKWICLFYDKKYNCFRKVSSGWFTISHTMGDREMENRKILNIDLRKGLSKTWKR